jgi:DNA-binding transcriptional LysR family regulator
MGLVVAGVALMPRAMLTIFPDRERLSVHSLAPAFRQSSTVLVWRKGAGSANVLALCQLLSAQPQPGA